MNSRQTVYFMSLVGGVAGLACWFLTTVLSDLSWFNHLPGWIQTAAGPTIMGAMIGALTVGFADRWTSDRIVARWIGMGLLLGTGGGLLAGGAAIPLQSFFATQKALMNTPVQHVTLWAIAGGLIGLATGLRWSSVNPFRAVHALLGGLMGGAIGGVVYFMTTSSTTFAPLSYVVLGLGITLGVTLAPVLLRDGLLQFISSGDPRAQNKYASPRQEWEIQRGDRFVIGNQSADMSMSMYSRDVQIYIPDALMAPRHAVLFEQRKRFFIQQHPDNVGAQGQPYATLQLDNMNVVGTREIRDGDELVMGQTLLRFYTRKKRAEAPAVQEQGWRR